MKSDFEVTMIIDMKAMRTVILLYIIITNTNLTIIFCK